jgi:nickel transport protein
MRPGCSGIVILALALFASGEALAHRLNVFAAHDGTRITGEAYFSGGARARGIMVRALGAGDTVLAEVRTDADGNFAFPALTPTEIEIVADAADGHIARFRLTADDMGAAPARDAATAAPPAAGTALPAAPATLEQAVDRAVARRIAPLQRQIAEYESNIRLHDILGGIGYLVGIAGIGFWWLARREGRGR